MPPTGSACSFHQALRRRLYDPGILSITVDKRWALSYYTFGSIFEEARAPAKEVSGTLRRLSHSVFSNSTSVPPAVGEGAIAMVYSCGPDVGLPKASFERRTWVVAAARPRLETTVSCGSACPKHPPGMVVHT